MVKKPAVTTDRQTARLSAHREACYVELMVEKCTENLESLTVQISLAHKVLKAVCEIAPTHILKAF